LEFARDEVIRDQQLIALVGHQFDNGSWHSSSLPTVPLGDSDDLELGTPLRILGYPGIGDKEYPAEFYEVRHGIGYTNITSKNNGIISSIIYYVAADEPVELWQMRIRIATACLSSQ